LDLLLIFYQAGFFDQRRSFAQTDARRQKFGKTGAGSYRQVFALDADLVPDAEEARRPAFCWTDSQSAAPAIGPLRVITILAACTSARAWSV
jgi:hypothetical protein